jgi:hypothetical protein
MDFRINNALKLA